MPDGIDQFLWFVAGVFSYRIVSSMLNYGHMYSFMRLLKEDILKLLTILEEDLRQALELKHRHLRSASVDEEEIKVKFEKDKQEINIWKEVLISRLKLHWPKYYRDLLNFNNWKEAKKDYKDQLKKNS